MSRGLTKNHNMTFKQQISTAISELNKEMHNTKKPSFEYILLLTERLNHFNNKQLEALDMKDHPVCEFIEK
jgi:hypothetical protein